MTAQKKLFEQIRQFHLAQQFSALLAQGITRATIEACVKRHLEAEGRTALRKQASMRDNASRIKERGHDE